ncbi:MAG TPA: hypothetical protein PK402_04265 [Tepidisphaeraceae bacterium]|nr:hypothetical protein [Tepidisphaeraceae bacterium]
MPVEFTINEVTARASAETEAFIRQAVRVFMVRASERTDPVVVERAESETIDIPVLGDAHPSDSSLKVRNTKADPADDTCMLFVVTVRYDENVWLENPLSMPTQVSYDDQSCDEGYYKDCSGTPKLAINTAGDPFEELPQRQRSITVITLEKNVAHTTNYSSYAALRNIVNSDSTTIDGQAYAAGELYVQKISLGKIQTLNSVQFRTLTSTVLSRPGGWDQSYESRGRREKVSGSRVNIPDPVTKRAIEYLWPLNEDGTKKSAVSDEGFAIVLKPYTGASLSSLT